MSGKTGKHEGKQRIKQYDPLKYYHFDKTSGVIDLFIFSELKGRFVVRIFERIRRYTFECCVLRITDDEKLSKIEKLVVP